MPANEDIELKKLFVGFVLVLASASMIILLFDTTAEQSRFFGICLIVTGAIFSAMHLTTGRLGFRLGSAFPLGSDLWKRIGLKGVQRLDLGVGLVLLAGGCLLLLKFYVSRLLG